MCAEEFLLLGASELCRIFFSLFPSSPFSPWCFPCVQKNFFSLVLPNCAEFSSPWCSSCVQNLPSKCFCLNLFQCLSLNLVQPDLICVGRQECDPGSYSSCSSKSSSSAKPFSWASASSASSWSSKPVRIERLRLAVELLVHSTRQRAPPWTLLSLLDRKPTLMKPVDVTFGFVPEQYLSI